MKLCKAAILLFLLCSITGCKSEKEPAVMERSTEQVVLHEMKQDTEKLIVLYDSADLCTKEWTIEYREVAKSMQEITYEGADGELLQLVKDTKEYGKQLEQIAVLVEQGQTEEAINQLKLIQEMAETHEKELNRLYEKAYQ